MKRSMFLTLLASTLFFFGCTGQNTTAKNAAQPAMDSAVGFNYSFKTAHPNAQALMKEDFYWSTIAETGPFGSDDGWEAAQGFREWRAAHKTGNPVNYLKELMASWNYPYFDWKEMDTTKIKTYVVSGAQLDEAAIQERMRQFKEMQQKLPNPSQLQMTDAQLRQVILSASLDMNETFLRGQDNGIIGTAFAQLALEGKIDRELKELTVIALKRQLLPVLINRYDSKYISIRKGQLTRMLGVINKVK